LKRKLHAAGGRSCRGNPKRATLPLALGCFLLLGSLASYYFMRALTTWKTRRRNARVSSVFLETSRAARWSIMIDVTILVFRTIVVLIGIAFETRRLKDRRPLRRATACRLGRRLGRLVLGSGRGLFREHAFESFRLHLSGVARAMLLLRPTLADAFRGVRQVDAVCRGN
jgi:hypothetical protein